MDDEKMVRELLDGIEGITMDEAMDNAFNNLLSHPMIEKWLAIEGNTMERLREIFDKQLDVSVSRSNRQIKGDEK